MRNEGYTPGWGTFCLWSALFFSLSLVPRVSFLSFPGGSRVRGWTATSLLVWVCACLGGSRPRVDLITLFSSPEPCCRRRLGRASQVRDEQPAVPKLRRRDGARPFYHHPVRTSGLATRAGARHELGDHAGGSQGAVTEGRRAKGKSRLLFLFLFIGFCVNVCGRRLWGEVKLL